MPLQGNWHLLFSVFLLACTLNACAFPPDEKTKKSTDNTRFNHLLEIHDLSERAFAYHQYCLKGSEPINETFMQNFKTTSDLLFDEAVYEIKMQPKFVVERALNRRKMIQQHLSQHYYSKGCQSEEGKIAKEHYRVFSQMNEDQVVDLFKDKK